MASSRLGEGGVAASHRRNRISVAPVAGARASSWLKPDAPFLPKLVNFGKVIPEFAAFKQEFYGFLDQALAHLFALRPDLAMIGPVELWRWCAAAEKYGAIYFLCRREACALAPIFHDNVRTVRRISRVLRAGGLSNRLFNYAVCAWVHSDGERRNYSRIRLPRNGIMSAGGREIYVNKSDFKGVSPKQVFEQPVALYDLHDFVHHVCSRVSSELYGCRYFGVFSSFERGLQSLVRDHRHASAEPNLFGDSLMFRQLSLGLFDSLYDSGASDSALVEAISAELSRYLRGETALLQPSTGQWLATHRVLDPTELAVLSQNKAYEHTASECEELLFVRGGTDRADPFSGQDTPERIQAMAEAPLNYFERRNFLRHRAHKRAYLLHARYLREQYSPGSATTEFLDEIFDNLCFADHLAGRRLDLFSRVSELDGTLSD